MKGELLMLATSLQWDSSIVSMRWNSCTSSVLSLYTSSWICLYWGNRALAALSVNLLVCAVFSLILIVCVTLAVHVVLLWLVSELFDIVLSVASRYTQVGLLSCFPLSIVLPTLVHDRRNSLWA